MIDLEPFLADEQADVATFVEHLRADQLSTPSLCTEWTVGDVAAHLVANLELSMPAMIAGTIAAGLRPNRFIATHAKRQPRRTPNEIAVCLRSKIGTVRESDHSAFFVDTMVHHQDMRRPLGVTRDIPEERLSACLNALVTLGFPVGAKTRAKGLRFEATDLSWRYGDGPQVNGPAESLLLALAGRPAAMTEIRGEGSAVLSSRQRN